MAAAAVKGTTPAAVGNIPTPAVIVQPGCAAKKRAPEPRRPYALLPVLPGVLQRTHPAQTKSPGKHFGVDGRMATLRPTVISMSIAADALPIVMDGLAVIEIATVPKRSDPTATIVATIMDAIRFTTSRFETTSSIAMPKPTESDGIKVIAIVRVAIADGCVCDVDRVPLRSF